MPFARWFPGSMVILGLLLGGCDTKSTCGDGKQEEQEECDDGNQNNADGCSNACKLPKCGDGVVQASEECDDGNSTDGDGCTKECKSECPALCDARCSGSSAECKKTYCQKSCVKELDAYTKCALGGAVCHKQAVSLHCVLTTDDRVICEGAPEGMEASQISQGASHTCALKKDGSVVCWGYSPYGQINAPDGLQASQISTKLGHTCALKKDGSVVCWGSNASGQLSVPDGLQASQLSVGGVHTCALKKDGSVVCWGSNSYGQLSVPDGLQASQLSAGGAHTCALKKDGSVVCWGNNSYGELSVPDGLQASQISSGLYGICALKKDGSVVCWGNNEYGQLNVPDGLQASQISAGIGHACAVKKDGSVVCWGGGQDGERKCEDAKACKELDKTRCVQEYDAYTACSKKGCGDGVLVAGEMCDDGNNKDGDGCSADCKSENFCGNGKTESEKNKEECDDGNKDDSDDCRNTCKKQHCFDKAKNGDETDVDCGGSCANKCSDGQACQVGKDCNGGTCDNKVCSSPGKAPTTCEEAGANKGCCVGNTLYFFDRAENTIVESKCGKLSCGWDADVGLYACDGTGADPAGQYPRACGGPPTPEVFADCGSGAGGMAGSAGSGGTAGGGGDAGSGGGAACSEILLGDGACNQCMVSQCCAEVEACAAKQECKDCIFSTSPECESPTSEIRACLQSKCSEACNNGTAGAAGSSGAGGNAGASAGEAGQGGAGGASGAGAGGAGGQAGGAGGSAGGQAGGAGSSAGGQAGGAGGSAGSQASGSGGSGGSGAAPTTCEQAHGFVGCCVGNTRYFFDPSTNKIDVLKCTDSCGWHADFGGYACEFDGVDPSGKYPLECGGAPIPDVVAECGGGSAGAGGSAGGSAGGAGGSAGSQASGSGGSGGSGAAPTTCEQAHGVVGCCVGNTNYYTVGFDVTSEACAPGTTCTWDSNAEFYSCGPGPAKADPSGQYTLACGGTTPPDIVAYCSGGVGGMAGAGGSAGSGGSGGYNGIAAPCMGCMAAQCKPVFDACFNDFACNQCAMFNPSGPGCASDPKFAALKACNCDLCGATDCSSECTAFGGNPGGSGGSGGSGGGAGSGGSGGVSGKIIYVTSSPKKANFGGIPGADAACNASPPGGKTYKALIVDGVSRIACLSPGCNQGGPGEGKDWVLAPSTTYVQVDGKTVIGTTNAAGVFSFPLKATFGGGDGLDYWTGLNADWTSSSDNCQGWGGIVAASASKGFVGPLDTNAIAGITDSCQALFGSFFACVEQ